MLNITGKYVAAFQPRIEFDKSEKTLFANLSSSKKGTDSNGEVTYKNMPWKGRFVGEAFEPSKTLRNGDKIDILRGCIENRLDDETNVRYYDVTIFEFAWSDVSNTSNVTTAVIDANNENESVDGHK